MQIGVFFQPDLMEPFLFVYLQPILCKLGLKFFCLPMAMIIIIIITFFRTSDDIS